MLWRRVDREGDEQKEEIKERRWREKNRIFIGGNLR